MQSASRVVHELFSDSRTCTYVFMPDGEKAESCSIKYSFSWTEKLNRDQDEKRSTTEPHQDDDDAVRRSNNTWAILYCYTSIWTFVQNIIMSAVISPEEELPKERLSGTLSEMQITVIPAQRLCSFNQ